jgi:NADPH:quinone reductase
MPNLWLFRSKRPSRFHHSSLTRTLLRLEWLSSPPTRLSCERARLGAARPCWSRGTGAVRSAAATIAHINGARVLGTVRSRGEPATRNDLSFVEWIDLGSLPLPESVKELTEGKGADLILDVVGGPLFQLCLESLAQRGRQIATASAGSPQVTFNLVNFYHKEARLIGLDTLAVSFVKAAEILKTLIPDFKAGIFSLPAVETISLDVALGAYREIDKGNSKRKFVIHFR